MNGQKHYIRTKDGKIYAFYDTKEIDNVVIGYVDERDKNALDGGSYFGKEDIRIADSIEELCDEFIVNKKVVYGLTQINKWVSVNKMKPPYLKEIYGAIWTDKGLIYVAEMNDKGELELL